MIPSTPCFTCDASGWVVRAYECKTENQIGAALWLCRQCYGAGRVGVLPFSLPQELERNRG